MASKNPVSALENTFKEFLEFYSYEQNFDWVSKIIDDLSNRNLVVQHNWHLSGEIVKSIDEIDFEKIYSSYM